MTTAAEIKALIRAKYPVREWALAFEVSNGTGSEARRHADAVAMNLWPSRGLAIHGFEFKVYRNDWLRELQNPAKAEPVAQYCDYWWLVTGPGIVKDGELPDTWGLMEVQEGKLVTVKPAPQKDAVPSGRPFMAALFRKMSEVDSAEIEQIASKRVAELDAIRKQSFEREVESRTRHYERLRERVDEFERVSGLDLEDWSLHPEEFGKAVKFVLNNGVFGTYGSIERLRDSMMEAVAQMGKVLEAHSAGVEYVKEAPTVRRRKAGRA